MQMNYMLVFIDLLISLFLIFDLYLYGTYSSNLVMYIVRLLWLISIILNYIITFQQVFIIFKNTWQIIKMLLLLIIILFSFIIIYVSSFIILFISYHHLHLRSWDWTHLLINFYFISFIILIVISFIILIIQLMLWVIYVIIWFIWVSFICLDICKSRIINSYTFLIVPL